MARATETEQTGSIGVSEVTGKFGRIGFGYAEITRHDNGIDAFLIVRDSRLFELGLTMVAQIKCGPSYFDRPKRNRKTKKVEGWWFRDKDGAHIKDWLSHDLPALVVLHHLETATSYWVHVEPSAVKSTGKGKKILVPAHQRVDESSREALVTIAATVRPTPAYEGSAWRGVDSIFDHDLLRYAMLTPRLVAPHPNMRIVDPVGPETAIALCLRARIGDLAGCENKGLMPDLDKAAVSDDWRWRLYAAVRKRVTTGDIDDLVSLQATKAPSSAHRVAATVAAAASLLEEDRPDEAVEILVTALEPDDASPVDHAWLTVQLARAHAEVGRLDEARTESALVQSVAVTHPSDATATAIAGAGAILLFNLLDWGQGDIGKTIEATDTAATWWRQQNQGWALDASLNRTYRTWAHDTAHRFETSDTARNELVAASLNATLVGAHADWRHISGLLGRDELVRMSSTSRPDDVRSGLTNLRLAGDNAALTLAVNRVRSNGPALAVRSAAAGLDLGRTTHSTIQTSLTLIANGGSTLDEDTADVTVDWLLDAIHDETTFRIRTRANFLSVHLVEALAGAADSATDGAHERILAHLLALPDVTDQTTANAWAKIASRLRPSTWVPANADAVADLATRQTHDVLRYNLMRLVVDQSDTARRSLLEAVAAGSSSALGAWGSVDTLPEEVAAGLIKKLSAQIAGQIADDARNAVPMPSGVEYTRSIGSTDRDANTLALLNRVHPEHADWEPVLAFVESPHVQNGDKQHALHHLSLAHTVLPVEVAERLLTAARVVVAAPRDLPFSGPLFPDGRAQALQVLVACGDEAEASRAQLDLLEGDRSSQVAAAVAARLAATRDGFDRGMWLGHLVNLAHSDLPSVRGEAVASLVEHADHPMVITTLERALSDTGLQVPLMFASRLEQVARRQVVSEPAKALFEMWATRLGESPLAIVRRTAGRAFGPEFVDRSISQPAG